jgi:hypothetical protein
MKNFLFFVGRYRMITSVRLLVLIMVFCSKGAHGAMVSIIYRVLTNADGNNVCVSDKPTRTLIMDANTMDGQCGVECTSSSYCQYYQFKANVAQCEFFHKVPTNLSVIDHCTAYAAVPSESTAFVILGFCSI